MTDQDQLDALPVGAYVASALMAANIPCDSGEDVDRLLDELGKRGYRVAAVRERDELREALASITEFRPTASFANLDPKGADLLIGVAAWMDRKDAQDGNPNHEVQADLRQWAAIIEKAAAALHSKDGAS